MAKLSYKTSSSARYRGRLNITAYLRGNVVYLKLQLKSKSLSFSTGLTTATSSFNKSDFSIRGDEQSTVILQSIRTDILRTYADFGLTNRYPDLHEIKDIALGGRSNQPAIPSVIQCLETFLAKEFEALEGIEFEKKTVEKKRYLVERIKQYILSTYGNRHFQLSKLRLVDGTMTWFRFGLHFCGLVNI